MKNNRFNHHLQETTEAFLQRIDRHFDEEKKFHQKIIEIFKGQHFGTPEDIAYLEGLTA